ncbi:MAG: hypothetical protein V1792_21985 [Pseudomonadota bacterium]
MDRMRQGRCNDIGAGAEREKDAGLAPDEGGHCGDEPLPQTEAELGRQGGRGTEKRAPGKSSRHPFLAFLLKAGLWGGITFLLAKFFGVYHVWIVVLGVFVLSVPIALGRIYVSTIRQIRGLAAFASRGTLFRFMSRRLMRAVFWILWALVSSFFMLLQFHTYSLPEWCAFFLVIPVFYGTFAASRRLLAREFKDYLVTGLSLGWAAVLTPFIMVLVYACLSTYAGNVAVYESFDAAVEAQKAGVADMAGSAVVFEASQWLAWYNGAKAFALSNLTRYNAVSAAVILAAGSWVVFFNACTMLACFLIPLKEYRRLFTPLGEESEPPAIAPRRMAMITAVVTFLGVFIYVPSFTYLEAVFQANPQIAEQRKKLEELGKVIVEQVGETLVARGTIEKVEEARLEFLRRYEISVEKLDGQADRAFDRMERNVDIFLDWYYSLPAEYMRIAKLLTGDLENYLKTRLTECLKTGDPFRGFESAFNETIKDRKALKAQYNRLVQEIISENKVNAASKDVRVVQELGLSEAYHLPVHGDIIDFNKRMIGSSATGAAAGIATAVVGKKIVSKIVGKGILKNAAKVLAKVVASKAAGTAGGGAAGAAAGAAVGSLFPVVGTAAGAVIGGIIGGLAVGVSVDVLMLKLEEAWSREDFKRQIVGALRDARKEFKSGLRGTGKP